MYYCVYMVIIRPILVPLYGVIVFMYVTWQWIINDIPKKQLHYNWEFFQHFYVGNSRFLMYFFWRPDAFNFHHGNSFYSLKQLFALIFHHLLIYRFSIKQLTGCFSFIRPFSISNHTFIKSYLIYRLIDVQWDICIKNLMLINELLSDTSSSKNIILTP